MKIRVSFTVDIDVDAWQANYGTPRDEIRDDVRRYVELAALDPLDQVDVLASQQ